jgi:hypothetical protein
VGVASDLLPPEVELTHTQLLLGGTTIGSTDSNFLSQTTQPSFFSHILLVQFYLPKIITKSNQKIG